MGGTQAALAERLDGLARDHYAGARARSDEHDVCAARWTTVSRALAVSAAVLAAAGVAGLFATGGLQIVGGILALLAAVVGGANAGLGANDQVLAHKKAKDAFAELASSIAFFRRVRMHSGEDYQHLEEQYDKIRAQREKVTSEAPRVPFWAKRKLKEIRELEAAQKR